MSRSKTLTPHDRECDHPLLPAARSFCVPLTLWDRLGQSIESLRQNEDPELPNEVRQAIVESAEGARSNIRAEVPVSGERDPWRHRAENADCSVSIVKAHGELLDLQDLFEGVYGGLTDPKRRAEACPGLGYVAKQTIDNLACSVVDLIEHFVEFAGVPKPIEAVHEDRVRRKQAESNGREGPARSQEDTVSASQTQGTGDKAPSPGDGQVEVASDEKEQQEEISQNKGGRKPDWDDLVRVAEEVRGKDPKDYNRKKAVREYHRRYARQIADAGDFHKKATPKILTDAQYRRKSK